MGRANPPPSYYIERTPPISSFVNWAKLPPDRPAPLPPEADEPADDPPPLDPTARVLSVIGPPGGGKTVTLHQIHERLQSLPMADRPLILKLVLKDVSDENKLHTWFHQAVAQVAGYTAPATRRDADSLGQATAMLCDGSGRPCQVVLVDGFEEAIPAWRGKIEQFLARVVMAENVRIVLPRRDNMALEEANLIWKETVVQLEPLPTPLPKEQIERRLRVSGLVLANWSKWDDRLDGQIAAAHLTKDQRDRLLAMLVPYLTPNPYINLLLLLCCLHHPDERLNVDDFRWCLEQYMERAGVPGLVDFVNGLKRDPNYQPTGQFELSDYTGPYNGPTMEPLLNANVVEKLGNFGKALYQLEAGVVVLISHLP